MLKVVNEIEQKQTPDVLAYLQNNLRSVPVRPSASQSKVKVSPIVPLDDPYGIN